MKVCPLSREMMFQSLSVPLQNSFRFLHLSATCTPIRSPYGSPSSTRRKYRLTEFFLCDNEWVRSCLSAGDITFAKHELQAYFLVTSPFWVELISIFSSFHVTAFISNLHMLTIPSSLAPSRLDAGSFVFPSRFRLSFDGLHCPNSFTPKGHPFRMYW